MPTILLVDNGSRRPDATLNLRRLAALLSERAGQTVYPVSLQHADKIPAEKLGGTPALTFEPFMREALQNGERTFIVLPLFFGYSRAISRFVPDHVEAFRKEFGDFEVRVADVLCPLPDGEPVLTQILLDNIKATCEDNRVQADHVILVDHGSPIPEVTAVREKLAEDLRSRLWSDIPLSEAVMERREGREYDFNGALLEEALKELAESRSKQNIILAMLFLSPGRHAGAGGDIEEIYSEVQQGFPGLKVFTTPLVGDHPSIINILWSRLKVCL
jgi:sirohydrochlorin ferrochelatase